MTPVVHTTVEHASPTPNAHSAPPRGAVCEPPKETCHRTLPPACRAPACRRAPRQRGSFSRQDCTDDLFLLWLEPRIKLHFTPGQYVTLGAGGIERPYSIASAPYEPTIELFIEYVLPEYGGRLTPRLYAQYVGDSLTMRPKAKGRFTRRTG